ncbi:hypothetical protein IQ07DRAFT_598748 [Pyrenochaeta sp. DS3sAY3a]|nr:hypothetical protein IQ07DRAFT_598748 [Pyrenochaeta sp. DS3sAY3a]
MCYMLVSSCGTCAWTLHIRYTPCSHATLHALSPATCPTRMKRRRRSEGASCGTCAARRGSLTVLPVPGQLKAAAGVDMGSDGKKRTRHGGRECDAWTEGEATLEVDASAGVGESGNRGQRNEDTHDGAERKGKKRRRTATHEPHKQRKQR